MILLKRSRRFKINLGRRKINIGTKQLCLLFF
jgi:hypothetical protein